MQRRAFFVILLSLLSVCFASGAWPSPISPDMPSDLARIKESGQLRFAVMSVDIPPFVFRKNGNLTGADVDLARDMAASLGVEPVFVTIDGSYDDITRAVAENRADVAVSEVTKTPERAQFLYYSHPYFISGFNLVANRLSLARARRDTLEATPDSENISGYFNKPDFRICTMGGTSTVQLMERMFPDAKHCTTRTWRESANLVHAGKADAAILPNSSFYTLIHEMPAFSYKVTAHPLNVRDPLAIAVRPGLPDLRRWINDYLDSTEGSRPTTLPQLIDKYLDVDVPSGPDRPPLYYDRPAMPEKSGAPGWLMLTGAHLAVFSLIWLLAIRRAKDSHWLLSPWAVLGGMLLGGLTGAMSPGFALFASPLADIYMNFWKLCVLPIMITTIITSVYRLLSDGDNSALIRRLLVITPSALVLIAALGIFTGVIGQPGANFSLDAQKMLVKDLGVDIQEPGNQGVFEQFMQMAENIVPDNALRPIVENKSLATLFIALFFGVVLSHCTIEDKGTVVRFLDILLDAFTRMVRASLYLLPFALYALALDFMAKTGMELLMAILRLSLCMTAAMLAPLIFAFTALRWRLRIPTARIFKDFGPMFLVAFSARSSVISMPIGLEALGKCEEINHDQAMAAFPLSLLVCHSTYTIFFSLTPMFIAQVFGVDLAFGQYGMLILGAVMCAIAAIGTIGMSFVLLLSIVCGPLGLPLEPAILVGMALVAITDPLISAIQALFGCGLTAILVEKSKGPESLARPDGQPLAV